MTAEVWTCAHCGRLNNGTRTQCKRCDSLQDGTVSFQKKEYPPKPWWMTLLLGIALLLSVLFIVAMMGVVMLIIYLLTPTWQYQQPSSVFMVQMAVVFGGVITMVLLGMVYQITHRKSKA